VPRSFVLGRAHAALGDEAGARGGFAAARATLEARVKAQPLEPELRVLLARAYAGLGWGDDAARELQVAEELLRAQGLAGSSLLPRVAEVQLAAGRRDQALATLRQALERRDGFVTAAALRADPRFAALAPDLLAAGPAPQGGVARVAAPP
jgi:tetratricopeptide (TPR) repeat protein